MISREYDQGPMLIQWIFLLLLVIMSCSPGLCQNAAADPPGVQSHLRAAQAFLRQQRPDLAVPEFEAVLAVDPGNTDAQANLGVLLYFGKDYAKAVPHLQAALQTSSNLWKIQALLGLAEGRLNKIAAAQFDLQTALPHLKGEKVQTEAGEFLIDTYTATGDLEKAASTVAVLLESSPTDTHLLMLSYRLHSDLAARALLNIAISAPHSAELHQAMARELAHHGDEAAAISNYREALTINPALPGLHMEFGNVLYNSTKEELQAEAAMQFEAALHLNPRDEKAQLMLGKIAATRGDLQAAYIADSRAVELQPNDEDACTELAKILLAMKQPEKARTLLQHAIELDPADEVAHYRLGTLDRQQGMAEAAKKELAEYQKYKEMKAKLQAVFQSMRVQLDGESEAEPDVPK